MSIYGTRTYFWLQEAMEDVEADLPYCIIHLDFSIPSNAFTVRFVIFTIPRGASSMLLFI